MKTVIKDIFLKQMLSIQKKLFNRHKDYPFVPGRKKLKNVISLFATYKIKMC